MQNIFSGLYVVDMAASLYSLLHISGLCMYRTEDFLTLNLCSIIIIIIIIIIIVHHSWGTQILLFPIKMSWLLWPEW
jgi:hypothetical protein